VGEAGQDSEVTYNFHEMRSLPDDGTTGRSDSWQALEREPHPLRSLTSVGSVVLATLRHIRSSARCWRVATWATWRFRVNSSALSTGND